MHFLKSSNSFCFFLIILIFSPVLLAAEDEMVFSLAAEGNSEELGEALQDFPDINKTDTNGMTLLLNAVLYGNLKNTVTLLEAGADPEISNGLGLNALFLTIRNGGMELVDILLDKGADSEAQIEDGSTPLIFAAMLG